MSIGDKASILAISALIAGYFLGYLGRGYDDKHNDRQIAHRPSQDHSKFRTESSMRDAEKRRDGRTAVVAAVVGIIVLVAIALAACCAIRHFKP